MDIRRLPGQIADWLGIALVAALALAAVAFAVFITRDEFGGEFSWLRLVGRAAITLGVAVGIGGALFSLRYVRNARWVTGALLLGVVLVFLGMRSLDRAAPDYADELTSSTFVAGARGGSSSERAALRELTGSSRDTPSVAEEAASAEQANQFLDGRFKVDAPTSMGATESKDVTVEIGRRSDPEAASLVAPATPATPIKITREIDVRLVSSDFDIEQLSRSGTLLVDPGAPAVFSFRITPRHQGPGRKFTVNVYGVLRENGAAQGVSLIRVHQQDVAVTVGPIDRVKLAAKWSKENWEPVAAVFGSLVALWTYGVQAVKFLLRRRRGATAPA